MSYLFSALFLLTACATLFAKEIKQNDRMYNIQDSVPRPTESGISISAIIARKRTDTQALPIVLFYTTYDEGAGDAILGKKSAYRDYTGVVAYTRSIRVNLNEDAPLLHPTKKKASLLITSNLKIKKLVREVVWFFCLLSLKIHLRLSITVQENPFQMRQ